MLEMERGPCVKPKLFFHTHRIRGRGVLSVVLHCRSRNLRHRGPAGSYYAGGTNPRQALDLYLPIKTCRWRTPAGGVYIHAAAGIAEARRPVARGCQPMVESGSYAGVAINYRLSGPPKRIGPPHHTPNAKAAIRWIRAQASRYGLDS